MDASRSRSPACCSCRGSRTIFGLIGIGNNLGAAAGPVLSGALYDWTGSYPAIYLWATGVLLVGLTALTVFCWLTRG